MPSFVVAVPLEADDDDDDGAGLSTDLPPRSFSPSQYRSSYQMEDEEVLPQWYRVALEGAVWYFSSFRLAAGAKRGWMEWWTDRHTAMDGSRRWQIATYDTQQTQEQQQHARSHAPSIPSMTARPPAWMQKWLMARLKSGT